MGNSSAKVNQGLGQPRDGQNKVNRASGDGSIGHGTEFRTGGILRHGGSARSLDGLDAGRAVPPGTAQNNTDGSLPVVYRNRFEKQVNGRPGVVHGGSAQQAYGAGFGQQVQVGGRDIDHPRHDFLSVGSLVNVQVSFALQQFGEHAAVVRAEVLHHQNAAAKLLG